MVVRELGPDWLTGASAAWTELLRQSDADPVFMSWEWISSWTETLGGAADLRVLGCFDDDNLVAVFPLLLSRSCASMWGGRASLAGVDQTDADYSDIVCMRGYEEEVARAMAERLMTCDLWVRCEFRDVLPTALVRRVAALMGTSHVLEDRADSVCPRTSLSGGWRNLLTDRFERKRRYNIERQVRLAEERDGLRLVLHDTAEAVSRAFPILVRLHDERKAAQGIRSAFSEPSRRDFHSRAAVKLAGARRCAFVATLESQREIVSAAYCLRNGKSLYYFQTGVSSRGSTLGAGSTLLYMLLRWAAEQGYDWFDFLKGDEDYKRAWATEQVQQRIVRITRRSLRGHALRGLGATRRALASVYHRAFGDGERG